MKLNKLLIAVSIATFALASCESEFTKDAELNVNVATGDGVSFDGQTITVKSGTPVEFHFNGDPDFLTFYNFKIQADSTIWKTGKHTDHVCVCRLPRTGERQL